MAHHTPVDCDRCDTDAPECKHTMDDFQRARQLEQFIEDITDGTGVHREDIRLFATFEGEKELQVFELGDIMDNPHRPYYEYTPDEAIAAMEQGASGFGLYLGMGEASTNRLGLIDNDDIEIWPYDQTPSDYRIVSGSGDGYHHPFVHDEDVPNANSKKETPYEGSVRTDNYYHLVPGSIHPSGGIYTIVKRDDIPHADPEDFPEDLRPRTETVRDPDGEKIEVPRDPEPDLKDAQFTNELGWSLEYVRERCDKLDKLLNRLTPGGYNNDRSVADAAAVKHLWYWGFSRRDIGKILRKHRRYEKTERDDYLYDHTIPNIAHGEQITEYYDEDGNYDPDPMSVLPLARLNALDAKDRKRYAKKRGIEWPTVEEVRSRLDDGIEDAMQRGSIEVISSPTGSGKTYKGATTPWLGKPEVTDNQPVIHAHKTREARDQARAESDDANVDAYSLKGRSELCPMAAGKYDPGNCDEHEAIIVDGMAVSEWIDYRCNEQGIPFSVVHGWVEAAIDGDTPCGHGEGECPSKTQFDGIPRTDDGEPSHDVIHCTHQFLNVPGLRMHTNVIIDEKPNFSLDIDVSRVRDSVNAYLDYVNAPVDNFMDLRHAAEYGKPPGVEKGEMVDGVLYNEWADGFAERMDQVLGGTDEVKECPVCGGSGEPDRGTDGEADITSYPDHDGETASGNCPECSGRGEVVDRRGRPPLSWFRDTYEAHALAPVFAKAIWSAADSAAGRKRARVPYRPPRFDNESHDHAAWNRVYVDVVLDENWEVETVEMTPDFSLANSVIGLDAHPADPDPNWRVNVHGEMQTHNLLDRRERTLYRRYERGLHTIQVGNGVQPVTTGEWLDDGQGSKFEAVVEHLSQEYGTDFDSAITSLAAKDHLEDAMTDAGVEDPELMHFGNEESRNDFAGKDVGLVAGSIDPGDARIVNMCARLDLDVEVPHKECPNCDGTGDVATDDDGYEPCSSCNGTGEVRERGRTFEGGDADQARAVLEGVREHHVAQSAGRWAREADNPDDTATVFLITDAAPAGFIDARVPGVTWTTSDEQRERLEYVRDQPDGVTAKEVADACDCSKRAAQRTLRRAREEGLLEFTPGAGAYGAHLYWCGDKFTPKGAVDTSGDETATEPVIGNTNTYIVSVTTEPHRGYNSDGGDEADWQHQATFEWYEPPDSGDAPAD